MSSLLQRLPLYAEEDSNCFISINWMDLKKQISDDTQLETSFVDGVISLIEWQGVSLGLWNEEALQKGYCQLSSYSALLIVRSLLDQWRHENPQWKQANWWYAEEFEEDVRKFIQALEEQPLYHQGPCQGHQIPQHKLLKNQGM